MPSVISDLALDKNVLAGAEKVFLEFRKASVDFGGPDYRWKERIEDGVLEIEFEVDEYVVLCNMERISVSPYFEDHMGIFFQGQSVWSMCCEGFHQEVAHPLFKRAIIQACCLGTFSGGRGPCFYLEGNSWYHSVVDGDFFYFNGHEVLVNDGKRTGYASMRGGCITTTII